MQGRLAKLFPLVLSIYLLFFISACTCNRAPLYIQSQSHIQYFETFAERDSLITALQIQLKKLNTQPKDKIVTVGKDKYAISHLADSIQHFIELLKYASYDDLETTLREDYLFYQSSGLSKSNKSEVLFTGYYEPVFAGSLNKTEDFIYPVYQIPTNLITHTNSNKEKVIGRVEQDQFKPYWTRKEIDLQGKCKGHEIAYLKDPYDVFTLHVQGSGKIKLEDGTYRSLQFAGSNGHKYKSIGKYLVETKRMNLTDVNMESLREYVTKHPLEQNDILNYNPRYIFFRLKKPVPPKGSLNLPLTPARSIAIDQKTLPWQLPALIDTTVPVFDANGQPTHFERLSKFMVPQDSGSAIKGAGRVDIFWGSGELAEKQANHMKERGELFFFVKKR